MDRNFSSWRRWFVAVGLGIAGATAIAPVQAAEPCGSPPVEYPFPYTDVASVGTTFCLGIMEAYVTGVSKGTTGTTFSPNDTVIRSEMTTFLQRSLDQGLRRGNRRAALKQWWTPQDLFGMQAVPIPGIANFCAADGEFIWVTTYSGNSVVQVQASTGDVLGTWTGATGSWGVLAALGKVFVEGNGTPGSLFVIDPTKPPGPLVSVAALPGQPSGIAFDGAKLWITNFSGSVSIVSLPSYAVTPVPGFNAPVGVLYDGANIWVTDAGAGTLIQLTSSGTVQNTIPVGSQPQHPVFDGSNIWVPNFAGNSITVVSASTGVVVATIAGDATNQLDGPIGASFDGERVLVTNESGNSVSLFKAADLSFIANVSTGPASNPTGPCSDGTNFWINTNDLLRF